jgi:hypothetical protein
LDRMTFVPAMIMKNGRRAILWGFIFFTVFIGHFGSRNITSIDSKWSIYTAMSILKEGNTNLDEYQTEAENDRQVIKINNHIYNLFPIGVSLMAVPFVYIIEKGLDPVLSIFPGLEHYIRNRSHHPLSSLNVLSLYPGIELLIASFVIALTAGFIYSVSRLFLSWKRSLLMVFIFAFCTSAWSTGSRGLWQHGPSMMMLTLTLYIILSAKNRPWLIQFAGIPLAFSYVIRPTNSISVFMLTFFVFLQYRVYFIRYVLWAMTIVLPFIFLNFSLYHLIFPPYYMPGRLGLHSEYVEALVGNLFSPARGLFVFSPILFFSIYGFHLKVKNRQSDKLDYFLLGILLLHWICISSFSHWWAGWSFGPRLFSDMIPFLIFFLMPVLPGTSHFRGFKRTFFWISFLGLICISFFIHYRGANYWEVYVWNSVPVNVDVEHRRVWDWKDAQFLRGMW